MLVCPGVPRHVKTHFNFPTDILYYCDINPITVPIYHLQHHAEHLPLKEFRKTNNTKMWQFIEQSVAARIPYRNSSKNKQADVGTG